jgi:Spy/CpxP family protein refolding chaperone
MDAQKQGRRRFFRRAGLIGLIGTGGAAFGWNAHAHGRWGHGHGGPVTEERLERMLKHLYVEVDATEAQKQRLGPIVREAVRELTPLHDKFHAARAQAISLLAAERVDAAAIEALRAEQLALAEQASRRVTRALTEAAEVLTPAQRRELAQRFERRHRRWS